MFLHLMRWTEHWSALCTPAHSPSHYSYSVGQPETQHISSVTIISKVCHVSRMTPLHQEYCSPHKYKMFCEKNFKIGVLKLCRIGFLDSLLWRQRCTIVQLYSCTHSACIAEKVKSQFRKVLTNQFWNFFHRTSCIHVGNTILDVME